MLIDRVLFFGVLLLLLLLLLLLWLDSNTSRRTFIVFFWLVCSSNRSVVLVHFDSVLYSMFCSRYQWKSVTMNCFLSNKCLLLSILLISTSGLCKEDEDDENDDDMRDSVFFSLATKSKSSTPRPAKHLVRRCYANVKLKFLNLYSSWAAENNVTASG